MTRPISKSKRARFRYILFGAVTALDDKEVVYFIVRHLTSNLDPNVKMIRFRNGYGVVRVERGRALDARGLLDMRIDTPRGEISLEPLLTSGTLASLKRKSGRAREALRREQGHR
jgi:RNase P/RNase MRP subunit POP5